MWFSVHSLAVLWLLKPEFKYFRERVAHWNIIACTINSSSFLYLEHHKQKEKANSTFLFTGLLLIMLHIAYLRRNGKFNTNSTRHLIITIFFTIPWILYLGPHLHFSDRNHRAEVEDRRAAQTGTTYAQTIRSAFKSSHSFREAKAWENIL